MSEWLETKKCVVAFIDLLGTSEAIKNDENNVNLNSMNQILQAAFDMCLDKHICKEDVQVKAFSDNIVFAMELPNKTDSTEPCAQVQNVLELCACFQLAAFRLAFSTRGGITIGDFFCNDIFVWGKGLVRAYMLESKEAVYPRILIDTNVLPLLPKCDNEEKWCHVKKDSDDANFLDYLSFIPEKNRKEYVKRTLAEARDMIKSLDDERAIQKVNWTIIYLENELDI